MLSSCRGHTQKAGWWLLIPPKFSKAQACQHTAELQPSAVGKTIPVPLESSHQTKYFCWAVSAILGLVEVLQEQGKLGEEALAVLHSAAEDVLCSTSRKVLMDAFQMEPHEVPQKEQTSFSGSSTSPWTSQ